MPGIEVLILISFMTFGLAFQLSKHLFPSSLIAAVIVPLLLAILVPLAPYWALGEASAIGWYDELDALVAETVIRANQPSGYTFLKDWGGGVPAETNAPRLLSAWTISTNLFQLIGPIGMGLAMRVGSGLLIGLGAYALTLQIYFNGNIKRPDADLHSVAFMAAIITLYISPYYYGFSFGGHGWSLGATLCSVALLLQKPNSINQRILKFVALIALGFVAVSSATTIVWFATSGPALLLFVLCVCKLDDRENIASIMFWGLVLVASSIVFHLDEIKTMAFLLDESSRYLRTDGYTKTPQALTAWNILGVWGNQIFEAWDQYYGSGWRAVTRLSIYHERLFAFTILFIGLLLFLFIQSGIRTTVRTFNYSALCLFLVVPTIFSALRVIEFEGIFSAFRWDTIHIVWLFILPSLAMATYAASGQIHRLPCRKFSQSLFAVILLIASINASNMMTRSFETITNYGGWVTIDHWKSKLELLPGASEARFFPTQLFGPKFAFIAMAGFSTFDGARPSFTDRRNAFWHTTLQAKPLRYWGTNNHRHSPKRQLSDIELSALKMVGVRYVLSTNEEAFSGLLSKNLISADEVFVEVGFPLTKFLYPAGQVKVGPKLMVREIDGQWDLVFTPQKFSKSVHKEWTFDYFLELKSLPIHSIHLASDQSIGVPSGAVELIDYKRDAFGYKIQTNGLRGIIVVNQEYSEIWSASCETHQFDIVPVNGIMMAITVSEECNSIRLHPRALSWTANQQVFE